MYSGNIVYLVFNGTINNYYYMAPKSKQFLSELGPWEGSNNNRLRGNLTNILEYALRSVGKQEQISGRIAGFRIDI